MNKIKEFLSIFIYIIILIGCLIIIFGIIKTRENKIRDIYDDAIKKQIEIYHVREEELEAERKKILDDIRPLSTNVRERILTLEEFYENYINIISNFGR